MDNWGSLLPAGPAFTAWVKGAGRGAGNGCVFFQLKGRGCGRRRGGRGDGEGRTISLCATGALFCAISILSLLKFFFIIPSTSEPEGCELFGSLGVGIGVGNDLLFLDCRD